MKLELDVKYVDGTSVRVATNLWVITQWERKYRRKASDLAQGIGVEDLAYLAWEGCKVIGHVVPVVFDDFIKKLDEVEVVDQEQPVPFDQAPTDTN